MLNIGPQELILILIVALVVVGPQRLPELGRTIGKALREFRKIQDDVKDTIKFDLNDDPEPYVRPKKTPPPRASSADGKGAAGEDGVASEPAEALPDANGSLERTAAEDPHVDASLDAESHPEPRAPEPRAPEPRATE
jgi:Tat protein translocase TatB subunit